MKARSVKTKTKKRRLLINLVLIAANILVLIFLALLLGGKQKSADTAASTSASSSSAISSSKTTEKKNGQKKKDTSWTHYDEEVKIPILMYHAVHDMDASESANANLIVSPEVFESHIKALSEAGYYFLTPEEAYRALTENALPAEKVVWLTFDDGDEDFYSQAYPILKKYKAKATNNIITEFVSSGSKANLTIEQMLEMQKNGISFESHTVNHPDLSASSQTTQEDELSQSLSYLENNLNTEVNTIAYPSGRYTDTTTSIASQYYQLGLTTNEGIASASNGLLTLNRVRILPSTTSDNLLSTIG
ncbi:polysaccharide deacetylase family protein [Streptococcus dentiloxodontae]